MNEASQPFKFQEVDSSANPRQLNFRVKDNYRPLDDKTYNLTVNNEDLIELKYVAVLVLMIIFLIIMISFIIIK